MNGLVPGQPDSRSFRATAGYAQSRGHPPSPRRACREATHGNHVFGKAPRLRAHRDGAQEGKSDRREERCRGGKPPKPARRAPQGSSETNHEHCDDAEELSDTGRPTFRRATTTRVRTGVPLPRISRFGVSLLVQWNPLAPLGYLSVGNE